MQTHQRVICTLPLAAWVGSGVARGPSQHCQRWPQSHSSQQGLRHHWQHTRRPTEGQVSAANHAEPLR